MDTRHRVMVVVGSFALIAYALLSALVKDTAIIWYQTRAFGLISYIFLFASVVLGELRLLTKGRLNIEAFKLHHGISVAALALVLAHFVAAAFDNFKWGKTLTLVQYLGFSFSNKWVALLSLGTLSFYMLIVVGLTSSSHAMRSIGFKGWRMIHAISYIAFFIAYVHAVNLGTDIKTSALSTVLRPMMLFSLILVVGLLLTRVLCALGALSDITEVGLAATFFILLLAASALTLSTWVKSMEASEALKLQLADANESQNAKVAEIQSLVNYTLELKSAIMEVRNGKGP